MTTTYGSPRAGGKRSGEVMGNACVGLMRVLRTAALAAGVAALAACSWFEAEEEILEGQRIPVRAADGAEGDVNAIARAVPPPSPLDAWTQVNGNAAHNAGHVAGPSALSEAWRADAGTGESSDSRVTAAPIVAGGRVFTLDAAAEIRAFDAGSGDERWRTSLVPSDREDGEEGFGGGLAIEGGRLYATTGFGEILALDAASGEILWRQRFGAPFRAGPAAAGGIVVGVTRDSRSYGVSAEDGALLWRHQGVAPGAGFLGGASPALVQGIALVPYASGELVALDARSGRQAWAAVMTGGRRGLARATITDLTGDPAVVGPYVVSANQSGRIAAFEGASGRRVWTRAVGSTGPIWPAGDTVYLVTDRSRAMRLDAGSGETLWSRQLPVFEDEEDREDPIAYSGPVLVGGRLLITDSVGNLWSLDPETGGGGPVAEVPNGSVTGPVAAGGSVYVLTEEADLVAYR